MSALEHVLAAYHAARRSAEAPRPLFEDLDDKGAAQEALQEQRLWSQEVIREVREAKGALGPKAAGAGKLRAALKNVKGDAKALAAWVEEVAAQAWAADRRLFEATCRAAREEWERRRERVFASAGRALELAMGAAEGAAADTQLDRPVPASPHWDRARRCLRLNGEPVRDFPRVAPAQFAVLDALQAADWPPKGVVVKSPHSVKDAVEALNEAVAASRLRFGRGPEGDRVSWHVRAD
jgi:hypothetical protein